MPKAAPNATYAHAHAAATEAGTLPRATLISIGIPLTSQVTNPAIWSHRSARIARHCMGWHIEKRVPEVMVWRGDVWHMRTPAADARMPVKELPMTPIRQLIRELTNVVALALVIFSPVAIALLATR